MKRSNDIESVVNQAIERSKISLVREDIELISSGCTLLDCILGGGYPLGRVINLVGDASSGKTLLYLQAIFAAYLKHLNNFKARINDAEYGLTFNTKDMFNLDLDNELLGSSDTIEEFDLDITNFLKRLKKGIKAIYALDCLDPLKSQADLEETQKQLKDLEKGKPPKIGTYGLGKQKYLSRNFFSNKSKLLKEKNCLLIIVSQVRQKIGFLIYGKKLYRAGGKALDHQCSQIIWLSEIEKHKVGKRKIPIGITIKAEVTKNKIGKPFRSCFIDILFDYGVDNISTNINFLYNLKSDTGKQEEISKTDPIIWDGEEFTNRKRLIRYIEENNQEEILNQKVKDSWAEIEEKAKPKRKKQF